MSKATPRQKGATKRQIHRLQINVVTTNSFITTAVEDDAGKTRGNTHYSGKFLQIDNQLIHKYGSY